MARKNSKQHFMKQREHARRRFAERLGITMNSKYRSGILRKIREKRYTRVDSQPTRMVLDIYYHGEILRVVYNKLTDDIITVLPKEENVEYLKFVPPRSGLDTIIPNELLDELLDDDDAYIDAMLLNSIDGIGY